ncbi:hypothetical protein [Vibrio barjaei]|uniref:hypothetical protein n=1 Tax=Vibrio barjaei TaxID=1676683 RepID=UPI0022838B23|nr:hypothetical protein [Vibrio barjaei]MCY9873826.1 hypothetical protein [Vibrio barjaei]
MSNLKKWNSTWLEISSIHEVNSSTKIEAHLFVPSELDSFSTTLSEKEYFHAHSNALTTLHTDKELTPLAQARLAKKGIISEDRYKVSLSLYAHRYISALDDTKKVYENQDKQNDSTLNALLEDVPQMIDECQSILRKMRIMPPFEKDQKSHYQKVDEYLSWYTEQHYLAIAFLLPKKSHIKPLKDELITEALKEQNHRELNNYSTVKYQNDPTRLTNRMRLNRSLIDRYIVLKNTISATGTNVQRMIKGFSTGIVMIFVTIAVLIAKTNLQGLTLSFVFLLSLVYGLREIFKDDLRDILWRIYRNKRPKWKLSMTDQIHKKEVGKGVLWFDYQKANHAIASIRHSELPFKIKSDFAVCVKEYLSFDKSISNTGYTFIKHRRRIDLAPIMKMVSKQTNKLLSVSNGQISKENLEKRHNLTLIIAVTTNGKTVFERWKVVISRNKIVDLRFKPNKDDI